MKMICSFFVSYTFMVGIRIYMTNNSLYMELTKNAQTFFNLIIGNIIFTTLCNYETFCTLTEDQQLQNTKNRTIAFIHLCWGIILGFTYAGKLVKTILRFIDNRSHISLQLHTYYGPIVVRNIKLPLECTQRVTTFTHHNIPCIISFRPNSIYLLVLENKHIRFQNSKWRL